MSKSQRIMNYTIEYRLIGSSPSDGPWLTLVPPVAVAHGPDNAGSGKLTDRPAGADPRDSHVGFRRIDVPAGGSAAAAAAAAGRIAAVRFRCLRSIGEEIFLASLALYKKSLPWE